MRKEPLIGGNYYHIINRSIAKYIIYNDTGDYQRMMAILNLHRFSDFRYKFSYFNKLSINKQQAILCSISDSDTLVDILAYCLMPTHFHFILKQNMPDGITKYITRVLNSYSRYFNTKHKRKGPLWEGHFRNVLVENDEQLLHLTRYIYLNPVSAGLTKKPEEWTYSSYLEYLDKIDDHSAICKFQDLINIEPKEYQKFVNNRISYQKEISRIKKLIMDDYSS